MQINSNDETVKSLSLKDLKSFNSQSIAAQAKKGEQLAPTMPAMKKALVILGDDIVELSTENRTLKKNRFLRR